MSKGQGRAENWRKRPGRGQQEGKGQHSKAMLKLPRHVLRAVRPGLSHQCVLGLGTEPGPPWVVTKSWVNGEQRLSILNETRVG